MKIMGAVLAALLLLAGCSQTPQELDQAMGLRAGLLQAAGCRFDADITADYGTYLYTFSLACQTDAQGNLSFTVAEPETLAGITGAISQEKGTLTFEGMALQFDTLTDGQMTPVVAPWVLVKGLLGGYLTSAGTEDGVLRVSIDDSYAGEELHLDVWFSGEGYSARGEILYDGRRIVSLTVKNFALL